MTAYASTPMPLGQPPEQTGHTPGPWHVVPDSTCSGAWFSIRPEWDDFGDGEICQTATFATSRKSKTYVEAPRAWKDRPEADEVRANARLIAAAPDLLDLLERILASFAAGIFVRNTANDIRSDWAIKAFPHIKALGDAQAAVRKARGLSPDATTPSGHSISRKENSIHPNEKEKYFMTVSKEAREEIPVYPCPCGCGLPISQDWIRVYHELVADSNRLSTLLELGNTEGAKGWYSGLHYDNYQDGAQIIGSDGQVVADCYDINLTPEQQFRVALDHLRSSIPVAPALDKAVASPPPTPPQPMGETEKTPLQTVARMLRQALVIVESEDDYETGNALSELRTPSPAPTDKEDTARLDWLEDAVWNHPESGNGIAIFPTTNQQSQKGVNIQGLGDENGSNLGEEITGTHSTIRQAIDAARAKTPANAPTQSTEGLQPEETGNAL